MFDIPQPRTRKRNLALLSSFVIHFAIIFYQLPTPTPAEMARAGTPMGSLALGPGSGIEAKPAIPLVFPDPSVYPWQLKGLQGDVIVEVTIDERGNVTATKILQSLQQDVDEKVIATLRGWRFRPASMDGVAISSRQDVHFHFPG
jgi:TonB family protein